MCLRTARRGLWFCVSLISYWQLHFKLRKWCILYMITFNSVTRKIEQTICNCNEKYIRRSRRLNISKHICSSYKTLPGEILAQSIRLVDGDNEMWTYVMKCTQMTPKSLLIWFVICGMQDKGIKWAAFITNCQLCNIHKWQKTPLLSTLFRLVINLNHMHMSGVCRLPFPSQPHSFFF